MTIDLRNGAQCDRSRREGKENMARTLAGASIELPPETIKAFAESLRGQLIEPASADYDDARKIWNAMIDRRPAYIAKCAGVADIRACVRFAREHELLTSVRGGGHNVGGNALCDDGLVIDLSNMNSVRVDPSTNSVAVEPGARLGEVDHETQEFGLIVPSGIVTTTGAAGLTLGGGLGWLSRAWGLTADHLLAADIVTAEGELVTASEDQNQDLFWAIRGGGGNFGIVCRFEFQAREFGPIAACGPVFYPMSEAPQVLQFYRQFTAAEPRNVTTFAVMRRAPAAPFLDPAVHGTPIIGIVAAYGGPAEEGMEALRPIKEFGNPLADLIMPKPYVAHQSLFDAGQPDGGYYYWKSHFFDQLTDEMLDAMIRAGEAIESPMSILVLAHLAGAVAQVSDDDTAYPNRQAPFTMNINGSWSDPSDSEQHTDWVKDTHSLLTPYATGSAFMNFVADEGKDAVVAIYGEEKYRRLQVVKDKWDPANFFRFNQNIKPTSLTPDEEEPRY